MMAPKSGICLKKKMPLTVMSAMPSADQVAYAMPMGMVRVQVFDLMGHQIESFSEPVASSKNFSLVHLKKGNYVVRVESSRFARTTKVAVK